MNRYLVALFVLAFVFFLVVASAVAKEQARKEKEEKNAVFRYHPGFNRTLKRYTVPDVLKPFDLEKEKAKMSPVGPPQEFLQRYQERSANGGNLLNQNVGSPLDECNGGQLDWDNSKYVNDNNWGIDSGSAQGWCCVSVDGGFGTTYGITSDGMHVGAYPSAIQGWHWGTRGLNTGLPAQVGSWPSVAFNWGAQHGNTGGDETWNVAYDLWLDHNPDLGSTGPEHEVMIWFARSNQEPIGYPNVAYSTSLWGINFDVYIGSNGMGTCTSYVNSDNTWQMQGDINDVLQDMVNHGIFDSGIFLLSVEAGNEIMVGDGWFWHTFWLDINGAQG